MSSKTKHYIVNVKETLIKTKTRNTGRNAAIWKEVQQYGNIKSIKVRHDIYCYAINEARVCYTTQKEAEEAVSQVN